MSNVEEHVVSMKFNNKDFEKNAQQSLGTLEKLKKALHFEESGESLKKLGEEADNLNLDKVSGQLDGLEKRFSTFGIVGMTAIQRVTNAAMDLGKSLINDVTKPLTAAINQIKSGGLNRAFNLEHAHFQLMGLVNDELQVAEILNGPVAEAVDGTAYGLDEAAVAASSLVASGVKTEELLGPLSAISGVAAMTSRNFSDISDIFTTVASNGKLMTMQLRQLSASGLNASAALAKYLNKTEAEVNEMVTKSEIDFATFSNAMNEAFGENAKRANETFSGALSNVKAALSRIGAKVATPGLEHVRDVFNELRPVINDFNKLLGSDDEPGTAIYHINHLVKRFTGLAQVILKSDKAMSFITGAAKLLGIAFEKLDKLLDLGGPIMIGLKGLGNVFKALLSFIKPVAQAFLDIFPPTTIENMRNAALHFKYFTEKLIASEGVAENIRRVFRGLFSVIKLVGSAIKMVIDLALSMLKALSPVGRLLTEIFGTFGDVLSNVTYYLTLIKVAIEYTFQYFNIFGAVAEIAYKALSSVWTMITSIGNLVASTLGKVINTILNMFGIVGEPIKDVGDLIGFIMETIVVGISMALSVIDALADGIQKVADFFSETSDSVNNFNGEIDRSNFFINVLRIAIESIKKVIISVFTAIRNVMDYIHESGGLFNAIGNAWKKLGDAIGGFFEKLKSSSGEDGSSSGESIFTKIGNGLSYIGSKLKEFADGLNMGTVALAVFLGTMVAITIEIANLIGSIAYMFRGVGKITEEAGQIMEALRWKLRPSGLQRFTTFIKAIAEAILALTAALVIISSTPNVDDAMIKLGIIAGGLIAMTGAIMILSKLVLKNKMTRQFFHVATAMVAISLSITLLANALLKLSLVKTDGILEKTAALVSLTLALAVAARLMSKNEKQFIVGSASMMGFVTALAGLVGIIALLSLLSPGTIGSGILILTYLTGLIAAIVAVTKFSKDIAKAGLMFIALAVALRIMARCVRLFGTMDGGNLTQGVLVMTGFMSALMVIMKIADEMKNAKFRNLAKMFTSLGLALMAMAVSIRILGKMDLDDAIQGTLVVAAVTALMLGLAVLSKKLGVMEPAKLAEPFKAMGLAILSLSAGIYILGNMDLGVLVKGTAVVAGLLLLLTWLTKLVGGTEKAQPVKMAILFGAMAIAIGVLAVVIFAIGNMSWDVVLQGGLVVGGILALFALLIKVGQKTEKMQPSKMALLFASVAAMIGVLTYCIKIIGEMPFDKVLQGSVTIAALMLVLTHIMNSMSKLNSFTKLKSIITSVVAALILMGSIVGALILLADVPAADMVKSALTISAMMLVLTLVVKSLAKMKTIVRISDVLVPVLSAIAMLATVVVAITMLSNIKADDILKSMIAITAMLLVMVGIIKLVSTIHFNQSSWLEMVASAAMMLSVGTALSMIAEYNWVSLLAAAASMGICLVAVALIMKKIVSETNVDLAQLGKFLLGLGSLVVIGFAIKQVAEFGWDGLIFGAAGLIACLYAYSKIFEHFNKLKIKWSNVAAFLLGTASLYLIAMAMSKVLDASQDWKAIAAAAAGLSACIIAVGAIFALMSIVFSNISAGGLVKAILGYAAACGGLYIVALALTEIVEAGDYQAIEAAGNALLKATAAMGLVLIEMAAAAVLGTAVIAAAPALLAALAIVTAIVIAMGAIYKIPFVEDLVKGGGKLLGLIGEAIGGFFGGIVAGFAIVASDAIPVVGQALADFADVSKPFWNLLATFKGNGVLKAAKTIASVVLELTAASFLNVITDFFSWLTGGDGGFQELADNLVIFGKGMAQFSKDTAGIKVASFLLVTEAAKNLSEVLEVLNDQKSGGLFSLFTGETDWEGTLDGLQGFGSHMKTLADEVKDIKAKHLTKLKDCASALNDLVTAMPEKHGAISELFSSYKDIGESSEDMEKFAESMVTISEKFAETPIKKEGIESAVNAAKLIAGLANELPEENGFIKSWFSSQTMGLDTFADNMDDFADGIVNFSDKVAGKVDGKAVEAAASAGQLLAALANNLPKTEDGGEFLWGLLSWGEDQDDLEDFGDTLVPFAEALVNFSSTLGDINYDAINRFEPTVTALSEIMKNVVQLGESNFQSFSNTFKNFGEGLKTFADNSAEIDSAKITQFSEVLQDLLDVFNEKFGKDFNTKYQGLTEFAKNINKVNDSLKMITDDRQTEIGKFGDTLEEFTKQYKEFASEDKGVGGVDDSVVKNFCKQLGMLKEAMADQNGGKKNNKKFEFKEFERFATSLKKSVNAIAKLTSGKADIDTAKTTLTELSTALGDFVIHMKDIQDSDINMASDQADKIVKMINNFVGKKMDTSGLASMSKELKSAVKGMTDALDALNTKVKTTYFEEVKSLGTSIVSKFAAAIKGKTSEGAISTACGVLLNKICNKLDINSGGKKYQENIEKCGENLVDGLIKGIDDYKKGWAEVYQAGVRLFNKFKQGITDTGKIQSPSKETAKLGSYAVQGFLLGLDDKGKVYESGANTGNEYMDGLQDRLGIHSPADALISAAKNVVSGWLKGLSGSESQIVDSGSSFGGSFMDGLKNALSSVKKGDFKGESILDKLKNAFKIESFEDLTKDNSKASKNIGKMMEKAIGGEDAKKGAKSGGASAGSSAGKSAANEFLKTFRQSVAMGLDAIGIKVKEGKIARILGIDETETSKILNNYKKFVKSFSNSTKYMHAAMSNPGAIKAFGKAFLQETKYIEKMAKNLNSHIIDSNNKITTNTLRIVGQSLARSDADYTKATRKYDKYQKNLIKLEERSAKKLDLLKAQKDKYDNAKTDAERKKYEKQIAKTEKAIEKLTNKVYEMRKKVSKEMQTMSKAATKALKEMSSSINNMVHSWLDMSSLNLEHELMVSGIELASDAVGELEDKVDRLDGAFDNSNDTIDKSVGLLDGLSEHLDNVSKKTENTKNRYDALNSSFDTGINLFERFTKTGTYNSDALFEDADSQLEAYEEFYKGIEELEKRNLDTDLIDQLASEGPAALNKIRGFLNMSTEQISSYNKRIDKQHEYESKALERSLKKQREQWQEYESDLEALQSKWGQSYAKALAKISENGVGGHDFIKRLLGMDTNTLMEMGKVIEYGLEEVADKVNSSSTTTDRFAEVGGNLITGLISGMHINNTQNAEMEAAYKDLVNNFGLNKEFVESLKSNGYNAFMQYYQGIKSATKDQIELLKTEIQTYYGTTEEVLTKSWRELGNIISQNKDKNQALKDYYNWAVKQVGVDPELAKEMYDQGWEAAMPFFRGLEKATQADINFVNEQWKTQKTKELVSTIDDIYTSVGNQVSTQISNLNGEKTISGFLTEFRNRFNKEEWGLYKNPQKILTDWTSGGYEKGLQVLVKDLKDAGKSSGEIADILETWLKGDDNSWAKFKETLENLNKRENVNAALAGEAVKDSWNEKVQQLRDRSKNFSTITEKIGGAMSKDLFEMLQSFSPEEIAALAKLDTADLKEMANDWYDADMAADYIAADITSSYCDGYVKGLDNFRTWLRNYNPDNKNNDKKDNARYQLSTWLQDQKASGLQLIDIANQWNSMTDKARKELFPDATKDDFKEMNNFMKQIASYQGKGLSDRAILEELIKDGTNFVSFYGQALDSGSNISEIVQNSVGGKTVTGLASVSAAGSAAMTQAGETGKAVGNEYHQELYREFSNPDPAYVNGSVEGATKTLKNISSNAKEASTPAFKKSGKELGEALGSAIKKGCKKDLKDISKVMEDALTSAMSNSGESGGSTELGKKLGKSVIDGLKEKIMGNESIQNVFKAIGNFMDIIKKNAVPYYKKQSESMGNAIVDGIVNGFNAVKNKISAAVLNGGSMINAPGVWSTYYYTAKTVGGYIIDGLCAGISENAYQVTNQMTSLAIQAKNAASSALAINSPSKVFMKIGKSIDEGMALGISKDAGMIDDSIVNVAQSTIDKMREVISAANNEIDGSLELTPTIVPRLDLSGVRRSASSINSLFDAYAEAKSNVSVENQNGGENTSGGTTFIQNNYSPKALNREEIYRQTRNQFAMTRKAVNGYDKVGYSY